FALEPPQHWLCSEERRGAPRPGDQPGRARQHARGWRSGRDQKSSKPPHGPEGDKKREPEAEGAESGDHAALRLRLRGVNSVVRNSVGSSSMPAFRAALSI